MAYPSLQELKIRTGEFYLVKVTTHGGTSPETMGQLQSFGYSDAYADRAYARVGGTVKHVPGEENMRFQIRVFVDSDSKELLLGMGHPLGQTYSQDEEVQLNPDQGFDYELIGYNGTGSSASVEHKVKITNAKIRSASIAFVPGQGTLLTSAGTCDSITFIDV